MYVLTGYLIMVASSCNKSRPNDFPDVAFETYIYLNNPSNSALLQPGGWIFHDGGYKGLIVYRRQVTGGPEDFGVYDRACPVHYAEACGRLSISDDDLFAECSCGGETYLLYDGSPIESSDVGLYPYPGSVNAGVLYVRN